MTTTFHFGTYRLSGSALKAAVQQAYTHFGMRHFDTAQLYQNEELLATTLNELRNAELAAGKSHTPIHITTKLSTYKNGTDRSLDTSLQRLDRLKKIDGDNLTVLLHWPMPLDAWRTLERALDDGRVQKIGVANYSTAELRALASKAKHLPCCNQIELHPFLPKESLRETLAVCKELGIEVHAHTVFGKGHFLEHATIAELAAEISSSARIQVSPVQLLLYYTKICGARQICVSSMRRAHIAEWFLTPISSISAEQFDRLLSLGLKEPVEYYGRDARKRSKAATSFSKHSQHAAYLQIESKLRAHDDNSAVDADLQHQIKDMAHSLVADMHKFCLLEDGSNDCENVSQFAIEIPSVSAAPNLLLHVAKMLFESTDKHVAICPQFTMTNATQTEQIRIKRFTAETLKRKYKGDIAAMDRSILSHLREVLRILRSTFLVVQHRKQVEKRANKKSSLFCTIKKKDDDENKENNVSAAEWATLTVADSLMRPFSEAVLHPTAMPVTVSSASEFADFFRDISSGTPTIIDAAALAPSGPTCAMKKGPTCAMKKGPTCALKNPPVQKEKGTFFADGRVDVCKQVVGATHIEALCTAIAENSAKGTFFSDGRVDVCKQVVGATHIGALCTAVAENAAASLSSAKGTFFADGRVDVCKQVVGSTHIGALCNVVAQNTSSSTTGLVKARHFLLGNNIACQNTSSLAEDDTDAGFSIASLMAAWKQAPIETFYLAGNCIGPNCTALFAAALANNESCNALWLKRNPIGRSLGPRSLGFLLSINQHLRVLDLDNCGLFDEGVREFANAATSKHNIPGCLEYLYLDANGITEQGARYLEPFLRVNKDVLRGLYISLNRLGSSGAIEIAKALQGSTSLQVLNLDSNSLRNDSLATILQQYAKGWPQLKSFSVGYYKSWQDMGESVNFIGAEQYEVNGERISINQNGVAEKTTVECLVDFLDTAPNLKHCSIKGNCFSHDAQVELAEAAWKRALQGEFHFDNKQLFQPLRATPAAPEMERLRLQRIKHGDLVVNIDSIYRNKM
jgi:diketogulonate reductase-like aldo/keto reductase/Ran GTPase-activating protein (RanGAP) involved in mRNA processing and transport